ncbi:CD1247 N-terminal domain-containing protein [Sporomusa sp.]|uniref:CD1247 N-terminal domain-containing protein n=1 Tax=Sporomusa sp. TaxID=2078658 RepID=UPI002CCB1935|nr:CD1247 N-terminal domain-containing protein [Sporomusa sp.]HWR09952.1 AraC family transcriptional regulator [Sporomusa sp.]
MRNLKEKVAYLHGLTQGLNVNENSSEGKVLLNIIDVLESFADEVQNVNLAQLELEDYVESIDEDLTDLEEQIYEEDLDDDEYDDDLYDEVDEVDEDDMVEVACPECHELVTFESNILDDEDDIEVTCPYCGGVVYDNELDITVDNRYDQRASGHIMHPGV